MKTASTFQIICHYPETEAGKKELARRAAIIHADSILIAIKKLSCPKDQKLKLLDAVIADLKKRIELGDKL